MRRRALIGRSLAATDGIPDAEQGLAASLFQTSFQVGGAIGLAVAVTGARPPGSPVWGSRRATRNVAL